MRTRLFSPVPRVLSRANQFNYMPRRNFNSSRAEVMFALIEMGLYCSSVYLAAYIAHLKLIEHRENPSEKIRREKKKQEEPARLIARQEQEAQIKAWKECMKSGKSIESCNPFTIRR